MADPDDVGGLARKIAGAEIPDTSAMPQRSSTGYGA
jgi:hypothetical protein